MVREAANNAVKTGRAPNVAIDVIDDAGGIVAIVEDDGSGFDVAATLGSYAGRGSLGLLQMREAARLIGGPPSIDPSPGDGARGRPGGPPPAGPARRPPRGPRTTAAPPPPPAPKSRS